MGVYAAGAAGDVLPYKQDVGKAMMMVEFRINLESGGGQAMF